MRLKHPHDASLKASFERIKVEMSPLAVLCGWFNRKPKDITSAAEVICLRSIMAGEVYWFAEQIR